MPRKQQEKAQNKKQGTTKKTVDKSNSNPDNETIKKQDMKKGAGQASNEDTSKSGNEITESQSKDYSITMDELHVIIREQAEKLYKEMNHESVQKLKKLQSDFEEYKEKQQRLIDNLRHDLAVKKEKLEQLEVKVDTMEQQSLQKTVRIMNIPEIDGDKDIKVNIAAIATDNLKMKEFNTQNIEKVHRMGKQKGETPRDLIVAFSSIDVRNKFRDLSRTAKLKTEDGTPVYVNENLTLRRAKLFYDCRKWRRAKKLHSTWTQRGNIIVKVRESSSPTEIQNHNQLRDLINPIIHNYEEDGNSDSYDRDSSENSDSND